MAALDQLTHLPVKESQQQGSDVRAVDIRIRHYDDAVIAKLVRIKICPADAATQGGDQRPYFCGRQHFVEARLLHIQNLSLERQNSLGPAIPALLRRAAG